MPGYRTNARQHDKNPSILLPPLPKMNHTPSILRYLASVIRPLLLTVTCLLSSVLCLSFPIRDLAADYYYRQVPDILDDETTEGLEVMPISERTMPAYLAAIGALQKTAAVFSSRSLYQRALSDLYNRLGKWS
jgi:hypothetical protein